MDDEQLARLLSGRNRPSVLHKEAGSGRVLAKLDRDRRIRRGALFGSLLSVAAVLLFVSIPEDSTPNNTNQSSTTLTPRGEAEASFVPHCHDEAKRCRPGSTLSFEIVAMGGARYFAAFAQRTDGVVLWYLPAPDETSLEVQAAGAMLGTGVRLGQEHTPGNYTVYGVFSREPLDRAALRERLGPALAGREGLSVVTRALNVEGA